MNDLIKYCEIFDVTTKWDRILRRTMIEKWASNPNVTFPKFDEFLITLENRNDIFFGIEFHSYLTFPFCKSEIDHNNLEAIRLLYDYNLDKDFMMYLNRDEPLFILGLSIDGDDVQMLYEKFLFMTQILESSLINIETGIFYKGQLAGKEDMSILLNYAKEYPVLCNQLRKSSLRISQLIQKTSDIFPKYYHSIT